MNTPAAATIITPVRLPQYEADCDNRKPAARCARARTGTAALRRQRPLHYPLHLLNTLRLRIWHIAAISFSAYYVLPFIAATAAGVLISPPVAHAQLDPLGLGVLATWLSRRAGVELYYMTDLVHLMMSSMVLVGSGLLAHTLTQLPRVVRDLHESGKLLVSAHDADLAFEQAGAGYRAGLGRLWRAMFVVIAIALAFVIERKTHDPALLAWWGHASHGAAGHLFAVAVGLMIAIGGSWLFLLSSGLGALSQLLREPVHLEPFHPDGCNGFAKLGDYLMTMFLLSVVIAATAWLCLWKGYLGVEHLALTWMAGALGILVIPIVLITPLVRCTRRIAAARLERLGGVLAVLERDLKRVEADSTASRDPVILRDDLCRLRETQAAAMALYPTNVFPFKPKLAGTLSVTYILQVILFLREAYSKLVP